MELSINKQLYYYHKSIPLEDDIGPLTDWSTKYFKCLFSHQQKTQASKKLNIMHQNVNVSSAP